MGKKSRAKKKSLDLIIGDLQALQAFKSGSRQPGYSSVDEKVDLTTVEYSF